MTCCCLMYLQAAEKEELPNKSKAVVIKDISLILILALNPLTVWNFPFPGNSLFFFLIISHIQSSQRCRKQLKMHILKNADELCVMSSTVLRGTRVVLPAKLRALLLLNIGGLPLLHSLR